jgi:hypothetical protein
VAVLTHRLVNGKGSNFEIGVKWTFSSFLVIGCHIFS